MLTFSLTLSRLNKKYNDTHPSLVWQVGDVRRLDSFPDESFDIVIDKACLDALVCDEGDPWSPNERTKNDMYATLECVARILKKMELAIRIMIYFDWFSTTAFPKTISDQ